MNKKELVNAIAAEAKLTKVQAAAALDAALKDVGEDFAVAEKAARTGVNPATKAKIEIPAKKVVKFKAGAELAAKVK